MPMAKISPLLRAGHLSRFTCCAGSSITECFCHDCGYCLLLFLPSLFSVVSVVTVMFLQDETWCGEQTKSPLAKTC